MRFACFDSRIKGCGIKESSIFHRIEIEFRVLHSHIIYLIVLIGVVSRASARIAHASIGTVHIVVHDCTFSLELSLSLSLQRHMDGVPVFQVCLYMLFSLYTLPPYISLSCIQNFLIDFLFAS
ncbi:hypothetical protein BGZ63DRAFT_121485 [Mariannaea sp. PMI_226]|nr:hypothetical protein BGZ63DRAFT_121485 [Mariannaea sp. PMI_226]